MSTVQRSATSLCLILALLLASTPTFAQSDDDGSLPTIDFAIKAMQSAQLFRTDFGGDNPPASDEAEIGFHRLRYNLEVNAQLHERINVFVDLGHEPNDFGTGGNFAPAVDYVAMDLMLSDEYTFRLGTPVTSLFNFRGYSDGAATQGNPLIGNSPIDFVTAETGVQFVGELENAGFDLTVTSPTFFETFAPGTGFSLIAKGRFQPSDAFSVGAGIAKGTNSATVERPDIAGEEGLGFERVNWIVGDGENYNAAGLGQPNRYTHAYLLPGASPTMVQGDVRFTTPLIEVDGWGGIGFEKWSFARSQGGTIVPTNARRGAGIINENSQMIWAGATVKFNATETLFLSGRASYAGNSSDWASDLDETSLFRIQVGAGLNFWEHALWKVEFVSQDEGVNSPGQVGTNWYGILTELSFSF